MRVPVWRALPSTVVAWGLGAALAAAQTAAPLPQVAVPPINITLPNYSSVAVGEIGSLEANASLVRANDSSTAWYNPAGLGLATQSSVSGSAGTFQVGRIHPEELRSSGGSFQQIPSTVGFTIKHLFGSPEWAGGLSIAHVNAWSQSLSAAQGVAADPSAGRLMYSGLSDMSGWMASVAVARRTGEAAQARPQSSICGRRSAPTTTLRRRSAWAHSCARRAWPSAAAGPSRMKAPCRWAPR
jgi:hypothetical protein